MDQAGDGTTLSALLAATVKRWGDCPFLLGDEGTVRYGTFHRQVGALAGALAARGVAAGDRVAVILPSSRWHLYLWFALAHLGAVMMAVNPAVTDADLAPLLAGIAPRALVGERRRLAALGQGLDPALCIAAASVEEAAPLLAPRPAPARARITEGGAAPAALLLTSGTTDLPKVAVLPHAGYVLPAREFGAWMQVTPADRFLGCLPLYHLAGQSFAVSAIAAGAALAVVPRFSARAFWDQVRGHRATLARHLGEMLAVLCRQPPAGNERGHILRAVYGGGARPEIADEFERRFGTAVIEGYGLTETNTVLRNELHARRRGSIGRPLAYCEVRISVPAPGEDGALEAAAGAGGGGSAGRIGEIQVRRNPVMMSGYLGPRQTTGACFDDGWFRTGDLGWRDREGWFYFSSRAKDLIRRRGESLVPARIEKVLDSHPAVLTSAVVGVADEVGGEEAKAFVVLRPDGRAAPEELIAWCRSRLAEFEVPRYLAFCTELPRTDTNKVHKAKLRTLGGVPCYDRAAPRPPVSM